jgi:hypothetical protein
MTEPTPAAVASRSRRRTPRTAAAMLPLTLLFAACAPTGTDEPPASASPEPSAPVTFTPDATPGVYDALPTAREVPEWADQALPVDRPNALAPVQRGSGTVEAGGRAALDISRDAPPDGVDLWDVLVTCMSEDASPLSYELQSPTSSVEGVTELACVGPGGVGTPTTALIGYEGPDSILELTSTADAVYAFEVRPHGQSTR